jgi:ribose-phosphate pyrophosphokinase
MLLFSLDPDCTLAAALAADLDEPLARHEDRHFEDGEHKYRPLVDPRGRDAYVICSLHGNAQRSPQDKLFHLLMFIATLREHGAARVTAVLPYLAYARKDRQTQPFDPVTLRYVAQLFEAVGTAQAIVLEAHNLAAFQNAFRCPTLHLDARHAFDAVVRELVGEHPVAVASPDPGGVKRAQLWREELADRLLRPIGMAWVDKRRSSGLISGAEMVCGEVNGMTVLLIDDLIASGATLRRAAAALHHAGAREVIAFAAHGLFMSSSAELLTDPHLAAVVVTDSVPPPSLGASAVAAGKLRVVSAMPLFARAIRDCHASWRR